MSKPSIPSRSSRNTPRQKVHCYIGALVSDDFGGMRSLTHATANAFAKKKLDTASQSLQLRNERQTAKGRRSEARADAKAERGLQAELREHDRGIRLFWRRMQTKMRPEKRITHKSPRERTRLWPYASVALPKYDSQVIDRNRERGVFARFRYYSRRSAKAGVSQRVLLYCYNGAALDAAGEPYVHSNVGETIDEAMCAFDHLEQVNWAAQQGAKLLLHGILAVDHRQTPDEMMDVGVRWAEEALGRSDLPYVVSLHAPPADGDPRNWHLHILWSFRPMVRSGDYEWEVAEMLRTDLDNPQAMKLMREMYAATMTQMSFEAGQNQVWTAKSNAARGLPHEPQIHLGAAQTNRARQGEHVPANEENHERVMRSNAAVLDDDLRHADEALVKQQEIDRAILARWARPLVLPGHLPQRSMAATLSASLPDVSLPVARAPAMGLTAIDLPIRITPAQPSAAMAPLSATPWPRMNAVERPLGGHDLPHVPMRAAQPVRLEIANLRYVAAPRSQTSIVAPAALPQQRVGLSAPVKFTPLATVLPTRAATGHIQRSVALPWRSKVTVPSIAPIDTSAVRRATHIVPFLSLPPRSAVSSIIRPIGPVTPPVRAANTDFIQVAIDRAVHAVGRDDERRERDRLDAERNRLADAKRTAEDDRRRHALARLFEAILQERHYLEQVNGGRTVDPRLLERFGVTPTDLLTEDAQKRIAKTGEQQAQEVSVIAAHVHARPDDIVQDGNGWLLDDAAPVQVRALVLAWRNSPQMQNALGRVVATRAGNPATVVAVPGPLREEPGAAWRRARMMRDRAMAEGDRIERLDGLGMERPGLPIDRPGMDRNPPSSPVARRFPGIPGSGIGD